MKLRHPGAAGGLILSLIGAGTALAAGAFVPYNVIVPKLGGQVIAVEQTKVTALEKAVLCSRPIGAGYTQQVQIRSKDTNTAYSPWISFAQGQRKDISYFEAGNGRVFRLWIGNNASTIVDVQSQGNGSVDSRAIARRNDWGDWMRGVLIAGWRLSRQRDFLRKG